jgi:ribosomal protein S1
VSMTHVNLRHSNGAPGVIHVSNLRWEHVNDASALYHPGDDVTAQIVKFDDDKRQLELSVKALRPEPYAQYKARHKLGDKVDAVVERANAQHVNVRHSNGAQGHLHASQISREHVADASERYKPGDRVTAQITGFNDEKRTIELSAKALLPEPYPAFKSTTSIGTPLTGVVTGFNDYFAYVKLAGGVEGSIHVAQLSSMRVGKPADVLSKGQQVTAVVIGFDDQRKKVQLSLRQSPAPPTPARTQFPDPPPRTVVPARPATSTVSARPAPRPQPRSVVAEADTVADAVARGCRQLNVPPSSVTYEVLDPGEPKRLFRAALPARVRVTTR